MCWWRCIFRFSRCRIHWAGHSRFALVNGFLGVLDGSSESLQPLIDADGMEGGEPAAAFGATRWDLLMAAALVALLPCVLLFFFAQRYFIQGIVVSGSKG